MERERIAQRIEALRKELDAGQHALAELDARRAGLRDTILRISGAIQVLEELMAEEGTASGRGEPGRSGD